MQHMRGLRGTQLERKRGGGGRGKGGGGAIKEGTANDKPEHCRRLLLGHRLKCRRPAGSWLQSLGAAPDLGLRQAQDDAAAPRLPDMHSDSIHQLLPIQTFMHSHGSRRFGQPENSARNFLTCTVMALTRCNPFHPACLAFSWQGSRSRGK